jgi:Gp49-like protein DUF891
VCGRRLTLRLPLSFLLKNETIVDKPLVDYLGDGIWEVRSRLKDRIARVLFMIDGEEMGRTSRLHQEGSAHSKARPRLGEKEKETI